MSCHFWHIQYYTSDSWLYKPSAVKHILQNQENTLFLVLNCMLIVYCVCQLTCVRYWKETKTHTEENLFTIIGQDTWRTHLLNSSRINLLNILSRETLQNHFLAANSKEAKVSWYIWHLSFMVIWFDVKVWQMDTLHSKYMQLRCCFIDKLLISLKQSVTQNILHILWFLYEVCNVVDFLKS